jgi:Flp pilus assembly protein TadG
MGNTLSLAGAFRRFVRCRRGTSAIEFAFAAPAALLAACGVIDMSLAMFASTLAEGGLREASRMGITGYTPAGVSRQDRILQILSEHTIGLIDMSTANITFRVYRGFEDIGKPEPFVDANDNDVYDAGESFNDVNGNGVWDADMGVAGVGGPGDVVVYTMTYDWTVLTPLIATVFGDNGKIRMSASVAVRNEPWTTP